MKLTARQERLLSRTFIDYRPTADFIDNPLIVNRAEGLYCYDTEGKRYFDAIGGIFVAILGHRHPRVMEAMRAQMERHYQDNRTYADGMAASIYGEWPPLVNAARKPGEWQSYDIVFEAPRFTGRPSPGYFTVFWNGVMAHNRQRLLGTTTAIMTPHAYTAHEPELPLYLQQHGNRVRYRNIWVRRLKSSD